MLDTGPAAPSLDRLTDALDEAGVDYDRVGPEVRFWRYEVSVIAANGHPEYFVAEVAGPICFPRLVTDDAGEVVALAPGGEA